MNNIIIQSIRVAVILSIAFFAFISDVFAAPVLTSATATQITENSAKLVSSVSNPHKSSAVWFELIDGTGAPMAVGVEPPLYDNGVNVRFEHNLYNLASGQTYRFRSVAMEGGNTVYSPISSFTTAVPKQAPATIAYQPSSQTVAQAPKTTEQKSTQTTQATTQVKAVKEDATTASIGTQTVAEEFANKDGFTNTNRNTAAVIGSGNDVFPNTLIGWIMLLVAILIVILVGRMIYESTEKRKKISDEEDEDEKLEIE